MKERKLEITNWKASFDIEEKKHRVLTRKKRKDKNIHR
jgi:hypothetical protein